MDIENTNSVVLIQNCIFEANFGFNPMVQVGAGSVIMQKGDSTTIILSVHNMFFNSGIALSGN